MRRSAVVGLAVVGLSLAMAATAWAAFTQVSKIYLTATKAGHSSGVTAKIRQVSATEEYGHVKQVKVTFPRSTKFRLGTVRACKLTNDQILDGKNCRSSSQVGTGSAVLHVGPGTDVPATIKAYAAGTGTFLIVAKFTALNTILPLRPTVSGRVLTIKVPQPPVGAISSLKLSIPKRGTGSHALITAGRCTKHKFTVVANYSYYEGNSITKKSSSACTR